MVRDFIETSMRLYDSVQYCTVFSVKLKGRREKSSPNQTVLWHATMEEDARSEAATVMNNIVFVLRGSQDHFARYSSANRLLRIRAVL